VDELHGENIDVVEWDKNPAIYIANALKPSEVLDVIFDLENPQVATVIVPDKQLSLAIGKRGQNVRLAARLTGYRIDIRPESEEDAFWEAYDEKKAEIEKRLAEHPEEIEKFASIVVTEEEKTDVEITYEKEEFSGIDRNEEEVIEVIAEEEERVNEMDEEVTYEVADKETSVEVADILSEEKIAEDEEE
jgi:N utilization substance protein A